MLPLLDRVEPLATDVGGANTVRVRRRRQRSGYNTDVPGMVRALAEHGVRPDAGGSGRCVILGGGATACAALAALRELEEPSARVAVRDQRRTAELTAAAGRMGIAVEYVPFGPAALSGARLAISTVPAGAADPLAGAFGQIAAVPEVLLDVVYHPWPTPLAAAAAGAGAIVVSGFDLLLHQAALQVELLTGRPAPVEQMRAAGLATLERR